MVKTGEEMDVMKVVSEVARAYIPAEVLRTGPGLCKGLGSTALQSFGEAACAGCLTKGPHSIELRYPIVNRGSIVPQCHVFREVSENCMTCSGPAEVQCNCDAGTSFGKFGPLAYLPPFERWHMSSVTPLSPVGRRLDGPIEGGEGRPYNVC